MSDVVSSAPGAQRVSRRGGREGARGRGAGAGLPARGQGVGLGGGEVIISTNQIEFLAKALQA